MPKFEDLIESLKQANEKHLAACLQLQQFRKEGFADRSHVVSDQARECRMLYTLKMLCEAAVLAHPVMMAS